MKKDKSNGNNLYLESRYREQTNKNKKMSEMSKFDLKSKDKAKKNQFQRLVHLNNEYFPQAQAMLQDSSVQSSQTTKMRNSPASRSNGFRLKLANNSVSISERSTRKQLQNQISKLTNQLLTKDKALMKRNCFQRVKESQMSELYRIIYFYQGKIKYLEQQIKRYEQVLQKIGRQCDEKSKHKSQIQELVNLFQQMRNQNLQLSGKLEEKDYDIGSLEEKNRKQELKLNFLKSKNSFLKQNKGQINDLSSRLSSASQKNRLHTAIDLKERKQKYGNMQNKINKIQTNLNFLKKQNQNLQLQLQRKQQKIHYLLMQLGMNQKSMEKLKQFEQQKNQTNIVPSKAKQIDQLMVKNENKNIQQFPNKQMRQKPQFCSSHKIIGYDKQDPLNQLTYLPGIRHSIQAQAHSAQSDSHLLKRGGEVKKPSSLQVMIAKAAESGNPIIFKKLKYQLLTEQVSHDQLIELLVGEDIEPEILSESPYNLREDEAEQLVEWVRSVSQQSSQQGLSAQQVLKVVIPKFTNLTLRKENDLKIQIANQAMNRQQDWNHTLGQKTSLNHSDLEQYFKEWGLKQEHIDTLAKCHYEKTGQIQSANLHVVRQILERWSQK